jgi:teichuronic acid exporter
VTVQTAPADHIPEVRTPTLRTILHGLSWVAAGHIVGQVFWFGSLLGLATLLPPRAFGTVTVGLLMVTAATRLMEAGTRGSIIVAPRLTRNHLVTSLVFNVGAGAALSGLIVVISAPMVHGFAHGGNPLVLEALGLGVLLYAPAIVPLALLEKRLEFRKRAGVQAASTIAASTLAVGAAVLGAGVWSLVIRQLVLQALLGILGWIAARRLIPPRPSQSGTRRWEPLKRRGAVGFMLFSLTDFVVFNADYLVVGRLTDAAQLGLYSLAFSIAFAPVTQFSAQLGSVLFPAAAASDPVTMRRRTIAGVRMTCLALLPLIPVAIVLAPVLIPAVLGARWRGMVAPFEILIVVGVAHAIVNVIGESLSGTGHIGFRARVNFAWMLGMIGALVLLVRADGIRGAGLAHLFLYVPVAIAYGVWGMKLLGSESRQLLASLRSVATSIAVQVIVTVGLAVSLKAAGAPAAERDGVAAALGLIAFGLSVAVTSRGALARAKAFVSGARRAG